MAKMLLNRRNREVLGQEQDTTITSRTRQRGTVAPLFRKLRKTRRGHEQSAEILKGILRHIEIQRFKKRCLTGERMRRLNVNTPVEGMEARKIWFATRTELVLRLDLITVNGHVVEREDMIERMRPKARG
jgi:hypothetical protein